MPTFPAAIRSRLPNVGTTIFTVMSQMAHDAGAINLSQGFPDFQAEDALFERVAHWMRAGANQYAPMAGVPSLREAIVAKVEALYGARYDVADEVTVVAGATQGLFTAIAAMVSPGDEVIVFEPVYDSYVPAIELQGGVVVRAVLGAPDYRPDWAQVAALVTPRTRMIMINTPHNPTATVWTSEDMRALEALLRGTDIVVVADEVYEHIVFDGRRHESVMRYPGLAERSFVVSSFGKTYHVTGWKVGYVLAPRALMSEFRKVHQFNVFTVATPLQFALADYMGDASRYLGLPAFYQDKRDRFAALMRASRFELLPSAGTY
ncbi:MAG: methionine aminotransferase, partial [Rhodocyclaceae bacterium]